MKTRLTRLGRLACLAAKHIELAEHYEQRGELNRAREQRINLALVRDLLRAERGVA